jgi:hypothetical protein
MDSTHIHLAFSHVPVIVVPVGIALLLFGALRRNRDAMTAGMALFVLSALTAGGVFLTGEEAEDAVEKLPGVSHAVIERHEEFASATLAATIALGAVALVSAALLHRSRKVALAAVGSTAVVSLVTAAMLLQTANLGGQVRHTEIRPDGAGGALVEQDHD